MTSIRCYRMILTERFMGESATVLTLILSLFFVLKMLSASLCLLHSYIEVHINLDFFMETTNMNPD